LRDEVRPGRKERGARNCGIRLKLLHMVKMYAIIMHIDHLEDSMNASVVDLRYKMNEVLQAVDRRETVTVMYHGKAKAAIVPIETGRTIKVSNHPFFGMADTPKQSVEEVMDDLRGGRLNVV
jgi:antitoxin (DNA-binding transcriptional repressor) of toxin-antitoxin stability system